MVDYNLEASLINQARKDTLARKSAWVVLTCQYLASDSALVRIPKPAFRSRCIPRTICDMLSGSINSLTLYATCIYFTKAWPSFRASQLPSKSCMPIHRIGVSWGGLCETS